MAIDALLPSTKRVFRDRHDERTYLRALEIARRLLADPSLISAGREFLETHVAKDPHQSRHYNIWSVLLSNPVETIVRCLLEDSPEGADLRDTAPVFFVVTPEAARKLWTPTHDAS